MDESTSFGAGHSGSTCEAGQREVPFVDPTTSEREYTEAEMEFMLAMNEYKRSSGRMFPTWSEVLEVLQGLGYEKVSLRKLNELERAHAGISG